MDDSNNYQIDVWKGDWGLPSIDIQCLQILVNINHNIIVFIF